MSKLYPPYIEGTIPAFAGNEIVVPFSMNRVVAKNKVAGFSLKIKTVQNSLFIVELKTRRFNFEKMEAYFSLGDYQEKLNIGQHYKVQLAYCENNSEGQLDPGYFSTVGVVKYTAKPEVYIEGLEEIGTNNHNHSYLGVYRQPLSEKDSEIVGDVTEKVYTGRFIIFNADNSIYYDSGEILHNNTENTAINESTQYFEFLEELPERKTFYIQYIVTTNNGLICASKQYKIMQRKTLDTDFYGYIKANMNFDEGYIQVDMVGYKDPATGLEYPVVGAYLLTRAETNNLNAWEPVHRFILQAETPSRTIFKDCTIEHGKTYIYSLQQYNDNGLYSNRIYTEEVLADFEDAFLFDGTRQLRIRYNPKVSSFKNTVFETKVDTIGGKHPFIFRNGKVSYKEFPIAGLISYYMDEEQMFNNDSEFNFSKDLYRNIKQRIFPLENLNAKSDMDAILSFMNLENNKYIPQPQDVVLVKRRSKDTIVDIDHKITMADGVEYPRIEVSTKENVYNLEHAYAHGNTINTPLEAKAKTTNLVGDNIFREKIFKLDVLDWLTNGETKLFRSPTEGNYLVRLMNVSLSPEDGTGRMLHSFNCTAYEVAECTHENMLKYGTLDLPELHDKRVRWGTKELVSYDEMGIAQYFNGEILNHFTIPGQKYTASSVLFSGVQPGSYFYLNLPEDVSIEKDKEKAAEYRIFIGATGSLFLDNIGDIFSIIVPAEAKYQGSVTFSYEGSYPNTFGLVSDVTVEDVPLKIMIPEKNSKTLNVKETLEDLKVKIYDFIKIKLLKRPIYTIYTGRKTIDINNLYWDNKLTDKVNLDSLDIYGIYEIRLTAHVAESTVTHSPAKEDFHFNEELYIRDKFNDLYPLQSYLLGNSKELLDINNYSLQCEFNGESVDLITGKPFEAKYLELSSLNIGSGVYFEATYVQYIMSYYLEEENASVKNAYSNYINAKEQYLLDIVEATEETAEKIDEDAETMLERYNELIKALDAAIKQYKKEHGLENQNKGV